MMKKKIQQTNDESCHLAAATAFAQWQQWDKRRDFRVSEVEWRL